MINITEIHPDIRTLLYAMAEEDSNFCVPASFPGGIVVANGKRAIRLEGQTLKLGTRFILTKQDILGPFVDLDKVEPKPVNQVRRSRELNPQYKGKSKRKGKR